MQHAFEIQTMTGQYWLEIVAQQAELEAAKREIETLKATLIEHQAISDALVARAVSIVESGDYSALSDVIAEAAIYPAAREAARKATEAEDLAAKIAELEAQRIALLGTTE